MTEKTEASLRYHAFLLRVWQTETTAAWRATLEDPHSGKTKGFASLKELFEYLESFTSTDSSGNLEEGKVSLGTQS